MMTFHLVDGDPPGESGPRTPQEREVAMPETPQRADVLERGLLIGGKSVPASSGKLTDDVCPWDAEI
jgi:hypothetical protein